jgi:hypothetical protein
MIGRSCYVPGATVNSRRCIGSSKTIALLIGGLLVLTSCGPGSDTELDATKLTLELQYRLTSEPTANLEGQPGAAPAGAAIVCRLSEDHDWRVGEGEAGPDGGFEIVLDARPWPFESLAERGLATLNQSVECKADDGPWVHPLREPRVAVE